MKFKKREFESRADNEEVELDVYKILDKRQFTPFWSRIDYAARAFIGEVELDSKS